MKHTNKTKDEEDPTRSHEAAKDWDGSSVSYMKWQTPQEARY